MENKSAKNKRIAKNTIFLYGRMLFSLIVSLFTAGVVIRVLGVTDYGVYNVTGGVVSMFSFLNASLSSATSRFFNFEMGKGAQSKLQSMFSSAFVMHIILAVLITIVAETVGIWFLTNKLTIPAESMEGAHFVFQASLLSMVVGLTQAPYGAALIAEEKMDVFAYFDIAMVLLRLGVIYLLLVIPGNKLIVYSFLTAAVSIGMALAYRVYCTKHYGYCRFSVELISKSTVKGMLSFSGLDLYGNLSIVGRTQGINMLCNMFFGPVINAAVGISTSVQGAINGFATNATFAMKPQIIKSYSSGDFSYMTQLLFKGSKFSFLIILFWGLPIYLELPFIFKIWLDNIPDYTVGICRLMLLYLLFSNMSGVLGTGVHATGDIRGIGFINGTMYLMVVPITYFAFRAKMSAYIPFVLNFIFAFVGAMANFFYIKKYVRSLPFRRFFTQVVIRCSFVAALSAIIPYYIQSQMTEGWWQLICVGLVSIICTSIISLYIALDKDERRFVLNQLKKLKLKLTNRCS